MIERRRHGLMLRLAHCALAVLVLVQLLLAFLNFSQIQTPPDPSLWTIQASALISTLVFALTACLLLLRVIASGQWAPTPSIGWSAISATVHSLIYVALIALPTLSYIRIAAFGVELPIYDWLVLPALSMNVPLAKMAGDTHDMLAVGLLFVLVLHGLGAILHERIFGDPLLERMSFRRQRQPQSIDNDQARGERRSP